MPYHLSQLRKLGLVLWVADIDLRSDVFGSRIGLGISTGDLGHTVAIDVA